MKTLILSLVFIILAFNGWAQAEITMVNYQKNEYEAVTNEIAFPEKTIMRAIEANMELKGFKGKSSKGFTVYRNVNLPELGPANYDIYFNADRKSRRNKDNSTLELLISTGNDNFVNAKSNPVLIEQVKTYLNNIADMITAYDLEQQILDQQDEVTKSDKKYNNYIDEGQSLERKKRDIENDIERNKKDRESQLIELDKQKQMLEALKIKRKQ